MKKPLFRGVATALVTPFCRQGIEFDALAFFIDYQIAHDADALVVCGTTGETPTLSEEERRECIRFVCAHTNGRVPVIAGCGCNDTKKTIEASQYALSCGANALLLVTPYYNRPNDDGMIAHFTAIADAVSCPILLYNVPARTGVDLSADAIATLSHHENIVGVKEAGGNLAKVAQIMAKCDKDFSVYAGDDALALPMMAQGAQGVVSVASNLIPHQMHELCAACLDGDFVSARRMCRTLTPLFEALSAEVNPVPIKAAMELGGLCKGTVRLPLCEAKASTKARLSAILGDYMV